MLSFVSKYDVNFCDAYEYHVSFLYYNGHEGNNFSLSVQKYENPIQLRRAGKTLKWKKRFSVYIWFLF